MVAHTVLDAVCGPAASSSGESSPQRLVSVRLAGGVPSLAALAARRGNPATGRRTSSIRCPHPLHPSTRSPGRASRSPATMSQ